MTILSFVGVALVVWGLSGLPRRAMSSIALAGSFPAGVALTVGGAGVPIYYLTALILGLVLLMRRRAQPGQWSSLKTVRHKNLVLALLGVSAIVTVVSPFLFNGLSTVLPRPSPVELVAGVVTLSNVAQLSYLAVGVLIFFIFASSCQDRTSLLGVPIATILLLSSWRLVSQQTGAPFPENVFDNAPHAILIDTAAGGVLRFRGILTEPAGLAYFCIIGIAYGFSALASHRGRKRILPLTIIVLAVYLGFESTSTTFIIAGLLCAATAIIVHAGDLVFGRLRVSKSVASAALVSTAVLIVTAPALERTIRTILAAKLTSSSFEDRSNADGASVNQLWTTFGFGLGLGANRGSSLIPSTLGAIGLLGTVLLIVLVLFAVGYGLRTPTARPAMWVLIASIFGKVISGPEISDSSGLLWMSLGLLCRPILTHTPRADTLVRTTTTALKPVWHSIFGRGAEDHRGSQIQTPGAKP